MMSPDRMTRSAYLSGRDRSFHILFECEPGVADRARAQRLLAADRLIGAHDRAAEGSARHEVSDDAERRVRDDGGIGAGARREARIEKFAHRRGPGAALRAPVFRRGLGPRDTGDAAPRCRGRASHPREVFGTRDERVLDAPASARDRLVGVGRLVGVEDLVDRGVADRVRPDAPAEAVQLAYRE